MDIGTLTGQVAIEDQLTDKLTEVANHVKKFADEFDGAMGAIVVSIGAVTAAITGMAISVVALGEEGSRILGVENAFDHLAESAGTTGAALREGLLSGVKGTIDDMEAMQSTTKLLGAGMQLTADQANLMGAAARELGKATGTNATQGLDIMSQALLTGRVRGLQQQIGLIDLAAGEKKFADSIGTTVDKLNDAGKLEGKRIAILDATQAYLDRLGTSELSFAERIKQGEVAFDDWLDELRKGIASSDDVNTALATVGDAIAKAFGEDKQGILDALMNGINAFARGVTAAVPYVVDFAAGVHDAFVWSEQFWPIIKFAGEVFLGYQAAILVANAGTWLWTAATTAANGIGIAYTATMGVLSGEMETSSVMFATATASVNTFALATGALVGGYALGTWLEKNVSWVRKLSDGVQFVAQIFEGYSSTESAAMVETSHLTEATAAAAKANDDWAASITTTVQGQKIQTDQARDAAAAQDNHRFITDKLTESEKKYQEALAEYNSHTGKDYQTILDAIGNTMYEGIASDHARGDSVETLSLIYKVNKATIEDVINSEKAWTAQRKILDKAMAESGQFVTKMYADELAAEMKYADDSAKTTIKQLELRQKLQEDAQAAYNKLYMTSFDAERAQLQKWEDDQIHGLDVNVAGWEEAYDNIVLMTQIKYAEITKNENDAISQMEEQESSWSKGFAGLIGNIPKLLQQAFTGGGGIAGFGKALESALGGIAGDQLLTGPLTNLFNSAVPSLMDHFGSTLTTAIGGIIPVIGPAIGALVGPLLDKLFSMGGPSEAELAGRKLEATFEQAQGGVAGLGKELTDAGLSADQANAKILAMFAAEKQGAAATQAAIDDINATLAAHKALLDDITKRFGDINTTAQIIGPSVPKSLQPIIDQLLTMNNLTDDQKTALENLESGGQSFDQLTQAAGRYNLKLDDLGGAISQLSISHEADQIVNDWDALVTKQGADSDKVLAGMKGSLNDLLNNAMKTGATLPTALEPLYKQLLDTGQLTDATGQKIDDLGNVKFDDTNDPLAKSISHLSDSLNDLIKVLRDGLPKAAQDGAAGIQHAIDTTHPTLTVDVGFDDHGGYKADVVPMAAGGDFVVTKPTLFLAGEAGPERATFSGANNVAGRGTGGGGSVVINNSFSIAADVDSPAARERLRKTVDEATMAALRRQKRLQVA